MRAVRVVSANECVRGRMSQWSAERCIGVLLGSAGELGIMFAPLILLVGWCVRAIAESAMQRMWGAVASRGPAHTTVFGVVRAAQRAQEQGARAGRRNALDWGDVKGGVQLWGVEGEQSGICCSGGSGGSGGVCDEPGARGGPRGARRPQAPGDAGDEEDDGAGALGQFREVSMSCASRAGWDRVRRAVWEGAAVTSIDSV